MSARSLSEHLGYWQDKAKVAAYAAALEEVVEPGDRVLDLGSGTGLLGMLAVRAGAGKVWAVDSGHILGLARELAQTNDVSGRIEFVSGLSTDIDLPSVDVIVCDQIGGLAFDAGVLEFFADAESRALVTGGVLIPESFDLFLVPVEAPVPYAQVAGWDSPEADFDLSPARRMASNSEFRVAHDEVALLARGETIGTVASSCPDPIKASCVWTAERSGTIHGLSGWFDASLSRSVTVTNNPEAPERMNRWLNFYPVEKPIQVVAGDTIKATIDIRPRGYVVTWSVGVEGQSTQRMSTFTGRLLFNARTGVGATADRDANEPDQLPTVLVELAELSQRQASVDDLIAAAQRHSDVFPTADAATRFARKVYALVR